MNRDRFIALWERWAGGAARAGAGGTFEDLLARYRESHRRYHTPGHIIHCLEQFDGARGGMDDPDSVEVALWFHDAIYDPDATDNERRSADLLLERAGSDVPGALRDAVEAMVMATVHRELPVTLDEGYLVDIDLSSFGLPWERCIRDSAAVRDEFAHQSDEVFYARQKPFLRSLLEREHFCFTEYFRARHEARARENIGRYLASLET